MAKKVLFILILLLCGCSKRYSGSIRKNVVWRGKIKLTGDVVVERRGSLKRKSSKIHKRRSRWHI